MGAGIGAGISGGIGLAKFIYGAVRAKKGEKQMLKSLKDIKYTRPEEYGEIMNILKQREGSITSRREGAEERVRETTASSMSGIRQLADSPVAALGAYGGLKQREQQAIAGIGELYEEKRDEAQLGVASGLEMGAGYSENEQYYNQIYKNMVKANIGASKMGAGINMMGAGIEGMGAAGIDFAGTKYLSNTLNPDPGSDELIG